MTYDSLFGKCAPVAIVTDASVYGIGGWVAYAGVPIAWFADSIREHDARILGYKTGDNSGQQTFEGSALLVAVRLWSSLWKTKRVRLILRSDNVGALTIYSTVRGRSTSLNLLAREYALELASGAFEPDVIEHIPGISNTVADALSRRGDPSKAATWAVPSFLSNATQVHPPLRVDSWWRARLVSGWATAGVLWGDQS